jgi:hypothetical protein
VIRIGLDAAGRLELPADNVTKSWNSTRRTFTREVRCATEAAGRSARHTRRWGVTNIIRRLAIAFICLLFWQVYAVAADRLPVSIPIKFGVDKVAELEATVARHRNYYINLEFRFTNDEQRAFVRAFIGEPAPICKALNDCGETASFKITIRTSDKVVFEQTKTSYGYFAHSANAYYRNILVTPLKPGKYNFRIEAIEFGPSMPKADASIELSTDPRARDLE